MKYTKETVAKIIEALNEGLGRVRACKAADIHYCTFLEWMGKPEFSERIKKAEAKGEDKIKDLAKRGIIEKFQTNWQAAAWWLERKFPDEYKNRMQQEHTGLMGIGLKIEVENEKQAAAVDKLIKDAKGEND